MTLLVRRWREKRCLRFFIVVLSAHASASNPLLGKRAAGFGSGGVTAAGARVADIGRDAITFEFVGRPDQVEAFEELIRPYGVRELVRTGRVGLRRPSASNRTSTPSVQQV